MARTQAPKSLKKAGNQFWKTVMAEFVLESGHDLTRLEMACSCLDTIAESETIVEKEGLFVLDRFEQQKEHPGLKTIRDNKVIFCRIIRELGLDLEPPSDSRPRGRY